MAEMARDLVNAGLVQPEDEAEVAKRLQEQLDKLAEAGVVFKQHHKDQERTFLDELRLKKHGPEPPVEGDDEAAEA